MTYKVDQNKWCQFSQDVQLKNIAAELSRATEAGLQKNNKKTGDDWEQNAYARAISLIDASIADPKWKDRSKLYLLRDAVAALYAGKPHPAISRLIYTQLLDK